MAVNAPDADEFDREDLRLSPQTHQALAEMATERGAEYDPAEYEERIAKRHDQRPHPIEDAESIEGNEEAFTEWLEAGE